MKKIALVLSFLPMLFTGSGCNKDNSCEAKPVSSETGIMASYAASHSMSPTTDPSGLVYQIINPGNSTKPNPTNTIKVSYTGKLLNDSVFDSPPAPVTFYLGNTIPGFQLALQLIGEGGSIRVLIPSSLAYGCTGNNSIPKDAVLYFDINLIDVL